MPHTHSHMTITTWWFRVFQHHIVIVMRGVAIVAGPLATSCELRSTRAGRVGGHWVSYFCIELVFFTFFFIVLYEFVSFLLVLTVCL